MYVEIPISHNFFSAIIEKLQEYTGLKHQPTKIRQLNAVSTAPLVV
jgi:hypothetical protein